jgi:hypothetical protein
MHYGSVIEELIAIVEKTQRTTYPGNRTTSLPKCAVSVNSRGAGGESTNVEEFQSDSCDFVYSLQELEQAVMGVA